MRIPSTYTLLTKADDAMAAVHAFWPELYGKHRVDLPRFQAVLQGHMPQVPENAWAEVWQYSMPNLQPPQAKADGKALSPKNIAARFIKALLGPVQWLLVQSYPASLRGAPPHTNWRDAHIGLRPKVPGFAKLQD